MKTLVLGRGVSGIAAARFLCKQGHCVIGVDSSPAALETHEVTQLQQLGPNAVSRYNLRAIGTAEPGTTVLLMPFPAIEIKRFLLVHNCPQSGSPHLHRRAGDRCLAGKQDAPDGFRPLQ